MTQTPEADWRIFGPLGSGAVFLRAVSVRLLWFVVHPQLGIAGMPAGWVKGELEGRTVIHCGTRDEDLVVLLEGLFSGQPDACCEGVRERMTDGLHPFEKAAVEKDLGMSIPRTWRRSWMLNVEFSTVVEEARDCVALHAKWPKAGLGRQKSLAL